MKAYDLTSKHLTKKYDKSIVTIYRWIGRGLPHQKIQVGLSDEYRFNEEEVEEWLSDNKR